ncbi:acylphosphatase, partial [candidate division WWE3 bacterium CG_4_10_14_0_2_um_filter_47_8]
QKGPLLSKVKEVDAKWESYEGTFSDFEIGG